MEDKLSLALDSTSTMGLSQLLEDTPSTTSFGKRKKQKTKQNKNKKKKTKQISKQITNNLTKKKKTTKYPPPEKHNKNKIRSIQLF